MNRRVLVLAAAVAAAVVVVGLSAAATVSARSEPTKATTPAKQSADVGPSTSPKGQQQSPQDVASYWTKERMQNAKPAVKSVAGSSRPSPASPSTSGSSTPAQVTKARAPATKPAAKPKAQSDGPVGQATSPSADPADYWTQGNMDDAEPKDMGVTGEAGGSSSAPGGPGGSTTPPAIP